MTPTQHPLLSFDFDLGLFDRSGLQCVSAQGLGGFTQWLEFEGARIAFDFEPPAEGLNATKQLLVLVNGYQRTRLDYRALRRRLKGLHPGLATLALDNRGSGETTLDTPEVSLGQMARDVACLATLFAHKLNLPSYALLGISMGGMISQIVAASNPQLSHLLLVSTTPGGALRTWPTDDGRIPEAIAYREWPQDEPAMRARMEKYFGQRFLKQSPLLFDMMIKNMLKSASVAGNNERSLLQFNASASFDGQALLGNIPAPTLVVTGQEDAVMPAPNAHSLQEAIKGSKLVTYPEVGHLILIEEPERFASDVLAFITT